MESNQFARTELLLGKSAMEHLAECRVAIFGIGGVGGYVCEALARSGVGAFDLIDNDKVCLSNINRQIIATRKTVGEYKTDVMKARILDINPDAKVNTYRCFFLPENAGDFPFEEYDYVVDAIDTVTAKIELVMQCQKAGVPIISSMGAGNKLDASAFRIADIYKTNVDPLAKVMRRELKKRGVKKLKVVYSEEKPIQPIGALAEDVGDAEPEGFGSRRRATPGSTAFVPSVAGLILAGEVIKDMTKAYGYINQYIDLHLHLDGAVTLEIAKKLAKEQGMKLPAESDAELLKLLTVPEDCQNLNDFLNCFDLPSSLMQTPEGLSEAVRLVAENVKSQGVIYAEIRFAPQKHMSKGMTQEEAIKAALDGMKKTDLKINLILCCMRDQGNEALNEETVRLAKKYLVKDGGVVAIDLAGAEALFPTEDYKDLFAMAKEEGIPFTIHAGEADGAESVRKAMEFGAARIGHGVRMYEDPGLVQQVKEKGITLEMCPTSNRQTHAVEDMSKYPFMDYLEQGIKVTLNTDDMGIEGTTLAGEFRYMEKTFGITAQQEKILLKNAVDAAFTTDEVKEELRQKLGIG